MAGIWFARASVSHSALLPPCSALAELARGKLRAKLPDLRRAFEGRVRPIHLTLLTQILAHIDYLEEAIGQVQAEIEAALALDEEAVALLLTVPGLREIGAAAILAEIGTDMSRFPSSRHLASWAGVCPGNRQSGGKRLSGKTTHGSPWLRAALTEATWANARRDNYLGAQFRRLARRRGKQRALVAVAHSLLVIIYHVLRDRRPYTELGADHFDRLDRVRLEQQHVRRLERLGYTVTLTPKEVA